jgi:hypothetical protein
MARRASQVPRRTLIDAELEERAQALDVLRRIGLTIGPRLSGIIHPDDAQRTDGGQLFPLTPRQVPLVEHP